MKLPKVYEPSEYESDIYALWEKSGAFVADPTSKKPHVSISMPPPNETATLHLGSALFVTLQDVLVRYARQQGCDVLWLPGTDHAAIATDNLVEKKLAEQGSSKHQIGREAFLEEVRSFVGGNRERILAQFKAMGASCDWTRLRYTLDDTLNRCVNETFIKMYNDGLIYRGHRIVNWDPNLETNVSDDEVVYQEEKTPFYTFQYGPFQIATARPETKFGDKYVVMHPDDQRFAQYKHGDTFEAEWINGTVTATVIKDESIDPDFGTGVMTITPWHSHADFEIAERHGLEKEQIIDFHGKLLPVAQEFAGMDIHEARPKIVEKLKEKGLLVNIDEDYAHNIAVNDRGKGIIEPQIRLQWFIDVNKKVVDWKGEKRSLKEVLQAVVRDKDIDIIPPRFEKTYFHWIDNLRDWCISRQIWWGHRIPVWYRQDTDGREETYVGIAPPTDQSEGWREWEQDPDTLDTWFSSALWTWSTLIDPKLAADPTVSLEEMLKKSQDFQVYHPTTVMETGWDILFFWVARMILATTYVTGQIPFKTVYLHGMVRTESGKKMSKSDPSTIIDPLTIIPEYGTDALRLALASSTVAGNDLRLGMQKIVANRNFCNKLWNIARYVEDKLDATQIEQGKLIREAKPETAADHWILARLGEAATGIAEHLDNYRFSEAYDVLYHFVWDDFADWYIEASKTELNPSLLAFSLEAILKITHPFAPFVTETIWQTLAWEENNLLATSAWPKIPTADDKMARVFEDVKTIVTESRYLTRILDAPGATLHYSSDELALREYGELIKRLARLSDVTKVPLASGVRLTQTPLVCWLDISNEKTTSYLKTLEIKRAAQAKLVQQLEKRLSSKSYTENAPEQVVQQTRDQLAEAQQVLENITGEHARFSTTGK